MLTHDHNESPSELDTLRSENAALKLTLREYRDHGLDLYGTLLCVYGWLKGDIPEADADQFIAMIDKCTGEPQS